MSHLSNCMCKLVPHHDPKLKTEMISEQDFNNDMIPTQTHFNISQIGPFSKPSPRLYSPPVSESSFFFN